VAGSLWLAGLWLAGAFWTPGSIAVDIEEKNNQRENVKNEMKKENEI